MSLVKQELKAANQKAAALEAKYNEVMLSAAHYKGTAQAMQSLAAECLNLMRTLVDVTDIRAEPGVYFLINESGQIVYVGQSENVMLRMSGHRDKRFKHVRMLRVPNNAERLHLETRFIHLFQPPHNVQYLGTDCSHELLLKEFDFA